MIKLLSIIKKNLLVITGSKVSLLILLLGPIFLMLVVGFGLSGNGLKDISATVYVYEDTPFTNAFIQKLQANSFVVSKTDSLERCKERVRDSEQSICIELLKKDFVLPGGLEVTQQEMENVGIGYNVKLHADFSKPRVVWGIISEVNEVVESLSGGVRTAFGEKFKEKMDSYSNELGIQSKNIDYYIGLIATAEILLGEVYNEFPSDIEASSINYQMISLSSQLRNIQNSLPPEYRYLLTDAIQNADGLKNSWDAGRYSNLPSLKEQLTSTTNLIRSAKDNLRSLKVELEEIQKDSQELEGLDLNYALHPIPMSYSALSGDEVESSGDESLFDYIFPSFISFFILLVSIFLSTSLVAKEKSSSARTRNELSKTSKVTFFLGAFITILGIVLIQIGIILFIASPFIGFSLYHNLLQLLIISAISVSIFIIIGMIFATLFQSQETAIIASISFSLIMIIFSSLITPLETLPSLLKIFISYTPLVMTETLLRKVLIFDSGIYGNLPALMMMLFIAIGLFALAILSVYYIRKREARD